MASRNRGKGGNGRTKETITAAEVGTVNAADIVGSESATEQSASGETAPATGGSVQENLKLKSVNKSGKTGTYVVPGNVGGVRVAKSAITNESFPATFAEISFKQMDEARAAKLAQKAERKAKSTETAQSRAAKLEARIQKAKDAAAKNEAKLAKVRARLAPKSAQEQTEAAAGGDSVPATPATEEVTE